MPSNIPHNKPLLWKLSADPYRIFQQLFAYSKIIVAIQPHFCKCAYTFLQPGSGEDEGVSKNLGLPSPGSIQKPGEGLGEVTIVLSLPRYQSHL